MLGTIIADIITSNFKKEQIKEDQFILFNEGDHLTNISLLNLGGYDAFCKCRLLNKLSNNTYDEWIKHLNDKEPNEFLLSTIYSSFMTCNFYEALSLNTLTSDRLELNQEQKNALIIVTDMVIRARMHHSKAEIKNVLERRELDDEGLYKIIEAGVKLFKQTDSFIGCIQKGLLKGMDRISIILAATLIEAYYNDINKELIHEAFNYFPTELGKIRPLYVFLELLDDDIASKVYIETINDKTKYLIIEEEGIGENKSCETSHSGNIKTLKDYILYYYLRIILAPEYNDLIEDLFIERNYEHAFKVFKHDYPSYKEYIEKIEKIVKDIENHNNIDELNADFKNLKEIIDSNYLKINLYLFDDKKEALSKLKEILGDNIYDYQSLFSTSFKC